MADQQDGFLFAYSVRETPDKGLGVFAEERIPKGSLVWRHVTGQYAVYDERAFRARIAEMTHDEAVYELTHMFGLADFPNCVIRVFDAGVLFNHSTDHNLETSYSVELARPLDPASSTYIAEVSEALLSDRYAMIATRDIEVGDEFTNNYLRELDEPDFFEDVYDQYEIDDSYMDDAT
ncbi:MAG: SET domain-containing protein [Pseudomonadota bacterium]